LHHQDLTPHDSQVVIDSKEHVTVFNTLFEAYPFVAGRADLNCFRFDGLHPDPIRFRCSVTVAFGDGAGVHPFPAIAPVVSRTQTFNTRDEKTIDNVRIDTGATDSLGPSSLLTSLHLAGGPRAQNSELADGSVRKSLAVLVKIALRDDPAVQVPIVLDYFTDEDDVKYKVRFALLKQYKLLDGSFLCRLVCWHLLDEKVQSITREEDCQ
jgi:hypothetical protein